MLSKYQYPQRPILTGNNSCYEKVCRHNVPEATLTQFGQVTRGYAQQSTKRWLAHLSVLPAYPRLRRKVSYFVLGPLALPLALGVGVWVGGCV